MSKLPKNKQLWIKAGYAIFAREGIKGLNVELIARKIKKNKSSYYYIFGDLENFEQTLLDFHLERTQIMANHIREAEQFDPDVLQVLVKFKKDVFFNRYLRLNSQNPIYKQYSKQGFENVIKVLNEKWVTSFQLEGRPMVSEKILQLIADSFFINITEENFNYPWLHSYLDNAIYVMKQISSKKIK